MKNKTCANVGEAGKAVTELGGNERTAAVNVKKSRVPLYRIVLDRTGSIAKEGSVVVTCGIEAAVLADDSGLEIDALNGRPGVITAYYGGSSLTWAQRRKVVLDELELQLHLDRSARFVCYLHFIDEAGREIAVDASVGGTVATQDRGEHGFSFDPIFVYPAMQKTFSELTTEEKNAVSHRRRAVSALLDELRIQPTR